MRFGQGDYTYELAMEYDGWPVEATFVSTGNPHVVVFVADVQKLDLNRIGPPMENYAAFPKRINAHWATVISRNEVRMRTWERGRMRRMTQRFGWSDAVLAVLLWAAAAAGYLAWSRPPRAY